MIKQFKIILKNTKNTQKIKKKLKNNLFDIKKIKNQVKFFYHSCHFLNVNLQTQLAHKLHIVLIRSIYICKTGNYINI